MANRIQEWWAIYKDAHTGEEKRIIIRAFNSTEAEKMARDYAIMKCLQEHEQWTLLMLEGVRT